MTNRTNTWEKKEKTIGWSYKDEETIKKRDLIIQLREDVNTYREERVGWMDHSRAARERPGCTFKREKSAVDDLLLAKSQ